MTKRPIRLAYLNDEGNWTVMATYSSYERADHAHDRLSNDFPNAHFEILDGALSNE